MALSNLQKIFQKITANCVQFFLFHDNKSGQAAACPLGTGDFT
jgi:hypothetical protein